MTMSAEPPRDPALTSTRGSFLCACGCSKLTEPLFMITVTALRQKGERIIKSRAQQTEESQKDDLRK